MLHCKYGNNDVFEERGEESTPDSWEHIEERDLRNTIFKENKNRAIHMRETCVPCRIKFCFSLVCMGRTFLRAPFAEIFPRERC